MSPREIPGTPLPGVDREALESAVEPSPGPSTHELVGIREISVLLGVQKRTVDQWRRRDVLPDPDFVVSGSPVWWVDRILAWAEQTNRKHATRNEGE